MATFEVTTTGVISPVVLTDLGYRRLFHPLVDYDLAVEYTPEELMQSASVAAALDDGYITVKYNGVVVADSGELAQIATGDMEKGTYDPDADDIVDKAESLDDGAGNVITASEVVGMRRSGVGNPNGVVTGAVLDIYRDTVTGICYTNVTGTNTGWVVM